MKFNCILLIEDDQIANYLTENALKKFDMFEEIHKAKNGLDALFFLKAYYKKENKYPDLIILDLNMPIMTGFEFIKKYKELKGVDPGQKNIVVLTTSTSPRDVNKAQEEGIDYYIQKPLSVEKIKDLLEWKSELSAK